MSGTYKKNRTYLKTRSGKHLLSKDKRSVLIILRDRPEIKQIQPQYEYNFCLHYGITWLVQHNSAKIVLK